MEGKLTLRERHLLLWVFKQKRLHPEQKGKYDALDESAVKGMFERLFFGTYKCLARLEGHTSGMMCLTLYGNKLFSAGGDCTIRVWDADTHKHLATLAGHTRCVRSLTLYGNKLFSGSDDSTIRVWNVKEEDS